MFASLKNKIKEETGNEIPSLSQPPPPPPPSSSSSSLSVSSGTTTTTATSIAPTATATSASAAAIRLHYHQQNGNSRFTNLRGGRLSSTTSLVSFDEQIFEQKESEINSLRTQCNELQLEVKDLKTRLEVVTKENERLEKTNEILLESVKVAQTQKDLITEEQEKIQNLQQAEIAKLKSLLSFREQEGYDQLSKIKQYQQQIESLTTELERLKLIEPAVEDLQDELERFRHAAQLDKNNLTTTLAAVEEENRHLKTRLQIVDQSRLESILSLSSNEKVQALIQERKLLEQHLEEAHLQLSDIKSSWSGQNLALETQVSRLSRQVAEETTEKRKALKSRDEYAEKVKQLEFELHKSNDEIEQRNTKVKLLEEEVDELSSALRECREESDEQILFLKNKAESANQEINDLKLRLASADDRLNEYVENSENITVQLRNQITKLQEQLNDLQSQLDQEKQEKNIALLRNAEISQNEELLKKELRIERDECNELNEKYSEIQNELKQKLNEILELKDNVNQLNTVINNQNDRIAQNDQLNHEINEKNKTIKILNQRLLDMKKTLQQEIKSSNVIDTNNSNSSMAMIVMSNDNNSKCHEYRNSCINISSNGNTGGPIVMDEVNFKYLKHVIVKFLTSREVEARHLIRAVATLLHLSTDEEKLLHDTLNWKMSWFGSKPDHGSGQHAFSIPPS